MPLIFVLTITVAVNRIGAEATEWVRTAAQYQLWHAAALLALAAAPVAYDRIRNWVGSCFCFGALLFSLSLYAMAIFGWRWVAIVTPLGGLLMLLGWFLLVVSGVRQWWIGR